MNRFSRLLGLAMIGFLGTTAGALANEQGGGPAHGGWRSHAARHFQKCLSSVGLSTDQQAAIQSIQTEARPNFQASFAAFKAAEDKLANDLKNGADKSALGQDAIDKDAAWNKIKSDHKAIHDQIVAQLHPDQQSALDSCMQERRGRGEGPEQPAQQ